MSGQIQRFLSVIFVLSIFISQTHQIRKYDLGAECLKLYKEDLGTVLLRFRRSPEYIKILKEKIGEFEIFVNDVKNQIVYYYNNKLSQDVAAKLGYGLDKQEDEDADPATEKPSGTLERRTQSKIVDANNISCVERLDSYSTFNSPLTVSQRNSMRDLGFTYAGHMIHALIKNLGPQNGDKTFTKFDGMDTTEHVSVHVVHAGESMEDKAHLRSQPTTAPAQREPKQKATQQKRFVHKERNS